MSTFENEPLFNPNSNYKTSDAYMDAWVRDRFNEIESNNAFEHAIIHADPENFESTTITFLSGVPNQLTDGFADMWVKTRGQDKEVLLDIYGKNKDGVTGRCTFLFNNNGAFVCGKATEELMGEIHFEIARRVLDSATWDGDLSQTRVNDFDESQLIIQDYLLKSVITPQ
jgi:hypothetical protein